MKKGDIVFGQNNLEGGHPIVFLEDVDTYSFKGVMLTKTGKYAGNFLMSEKHFKITDLDGNRYRFHFNSTHLVGQTLLKKVEWEPFEKVGELTDLGIEFLVSVLSGTTPVFWENYGATSENN